MATSGLPLRGGRVGSPHVRALLAVAPGRVRVEGVPRLTLECYSSQRFVT